MGIGKETNHAIKLLRFDFLHKTFEIRFVIFFAINNNMINKWTNFR